VSTEKDPFEVVLVEEEAGAFAALADRPVGGAPSSMPVLPSVATAVFHGFDLEDRPVLKKVPGLPHEMVPARTTVALRGRQAGETVVVVFEGGDPRKPIILGTLWNGQDKPPEQRPAVQSAPELPVKVTADDDRFVVTAEREIVLQCGDASITLTRAGKVLIKGAYILSRSSGYNKIKGAAVDIN
jgi:hypothetical protein